MNNKFIKSVLCCLLVMIMIFTLTACNYSVIDTKWNFKYAYIDIPGKATIEVEIQSWSDNSDSNDITITDKDGITYMTDYKNVVLTTEKIK